MNVITMDLKATESLLAFWRDAGVEACYDEAPIDRTWIAPPAPRAVSRTAPPVPAPLDQGLPTDTLSDARQLAAGSEDLEALGRAIAAFDGCGLKQMGARQAVFCRGNPKGDLLVIGEGPGAEEDARGEPFVGKAGQLLDKMLQAAGLYDRALITNTVFWHPPGNRTPTPQEQAVCAPFLERVLIIMKPSAVLLLGAAASKSVLGIDTGIMKLRGQWQQWPLSGAGSPVPALPTLHPAFLLRQPQAKRQVWSDLLSLAERLDQPAFRPKPFSSEGPALTGPSEP